MLKIFVLGLGPTLMIFIGLSIGNSVPFTFLLFYSWLLVIPLIKKTKDGNWNELFQKNTIDIKTVGIGLISGLVMMIMVYGAFTLLFDTVIDVSSLQTLLEKWNFTGMEAIILVVILLCINPILEELYWREYMYTRLKTRIGPTRAIILTAFLYSLYHLLTLIPMLHWPFDVLAVAPVFMAGILWGYFRAKLHSIIAPVISHLLADVGIMLTYLIHIL
ncbi:CPBP family intramembrane glutamic endopeptidase [Radiobacillus sp. PE A8.2]|uniref:CPBP family intramembrane glutamic endopeptidase n=1 Tax=Radiobacillus sp. PE A8.2 TaxID=3380349 RepID=UPI00389103B2